jgi:hypothetical protein
MAKLSESARLARIAAYKNTLMTKLASKIIDISKPEFADLVTDKGQPMSTLNGEIIIERDLREDGSLKGVVSISPDGLAAMLPNLKVDTENKAGWKKYLDKWQAEGLANILDGVANPNASEYELTAMEELVTLNIDTMSDYEAKQKLIALRGKAKQEAKV